ncbi:MAG: D-alanine--D-alanine ligase [Planctomycetes bacterium]|nr:D-alanine--D-alanine ligase [Planctomycetota bacterium]
MRIAVLIDLMSEDPGHHDPVAEQVAAALRDGEHEPVIIGVWRDLKRVIDDLKAAQPDLVFNLCESFGDALFGAVGIVGVLDLLGLRYTGGGPGEFYMQQDKALTKKLLAFDKIKYPEFAVFSQDSDFETGGNLRMPLFVKPLRQDASIGIGANALVDNFRDMMKRIIAIHDKINDAALVEEYIDGREIYVGVLGNAMPTALPPIEIDFSGFPEGTPKIMSSKAKWNKRSAEYKGTNSVIADLPDELKARVQKVALDAYRALRVRDYGRVDMRLTPSGDIYVLEVNASCYLERDSEFAHSAKVVGMSYVQLVNEIVDLAVERHGIRDAS